MMLNLKKKEEKVNLIGREMELKDRLEGEVPALKLCKELESLGVKQESLWWWIKYWVFGTPNNPKGNYAWKLVLQKRVFLFQIEDWSEYYSAFTVAELGKMLPDSIKGLILVLQKRRVCYIRGYAEKEQIMTKAVIEVEADSEANARAKMLLYLLKEGYLKPKDLR